MSSKVSSSSFEIFIIFCFCLTMSSSISSILWFSFVMLFSPYSVLFTVIFSLFAMMEIFPLYTSSLLRTFSSDTPNCFLYQDPTLSDLLNKLFFQSFSIPSEIIQVVFSFILSHFLRCWPNQTDLAQLIMPANQIHRFQGILHLLWPITMCQPVS